MYAVLLMAVFLLPGAFVGAATMSASLTAPTVDGEDIANYGGVTGTDKWWNDAAASGYPKGQTFTTPAVRLYGSIQLRIRSQILKKQSLRKPTLFALVRSMGRHLPRYTSRRLLKPSTWNSSEYMTWTFDSPVLLAPDTEYGIDIGYDYQYFKSWQTGIPYINITDNAYGGGTRYMSGTTGGGIGDDTMNNMSGDRVFHLDMDEATARDAWLCILRKRWHGCRRQC